MLIDGRSAYSPFLFGSVAPGLQTVAIADIERIEMLRGSNSASYGARAFLGVINIVTRDPADTRGLRAGVTAGENGVRDIRASLGWGQDNASYRLGVDSRGDDGLKGSNGHNRINRINFRADLRPVAGDELQVRLGVLEIESVSALLAMWTARCMTALSNPVICSLTGGATWAPMPTWR